MKQNNTVVPADKNLVVVPRLQDVFPEYTICGIESWKEVAYIGKNNINYLLKSIRGKENSLSKEIRELRKKQDFFRSKTSKDFIQLAKDYANPTITSIGVREHNWSGGLEPTDDASKERKGGSTQYNICGWCSHASGSHRYNYCLSGSCRLLNEWDEAVDGRVFHSKKLYFTHPVKFNTKCILPSLSADQFKRIIKNIGKKVNLLKVEREGVREAIRKLIRLRDNADGNKPWLVNFRPHDYMNVGDEMVAYIGNWKSNEKIVKGDWVNAMGIFEYRHHDGCMSYQAITPIHSNLSYFEGRGGGAGISRPELMHRWKFDFLNNATQHSDGWARNQLDSMLKNATEETIFLRIWFSSIPEDLKGFNPSTFFTDLISPKFVQPSKKFSEKPIVINTKKVAGDVLQMLSVDLFKTEKEIKAWANMQLQYVHPDKLGDVSKKTIKYAKRQTQAVCEARDFLINSIRNNR